MLLGMGVFVGSLLTVFLHVALLALSVFELDSGPSTAIQAVSALLAWGGILIFIAGVVAWIIEVAVRSARDV